jgi:hypothetical protein
LFHHCKSIGNDENIVDDVAAGKASEEQRNGFGKYARPIFLFRAFPEAITVNRVSEGLNRDI